MALNLGLIEVAVVLVFWVVRVVRVVRLVSGHLILPGFHVFGQIFLCADTRSSWKINWAQHRLKTMRYALEALIKHVAAELAKSCTDVARAIIHTYKKPEQ